MKKSVLLAMIVLAAAFLPKAVLRCSESGNIEVAGEKLTELAKAIARYNDKEERQFSGFDDIKGSYILDYDSNFRDPWLKKFFVDTAELLVISSGPDGVAGSRDDISVSFYFPARLRRAMIDHVADRIHLYFSRHVALPPERRFTPGDILRLDENCLASFGAEAFGRPGAMGRYPAKIRPGVDSAEVVLEFGAGELKDLAAGTCRAVLDSESRLFRDVTDYERSFGDAGLVLKPSVRGFVHGDAMLEKLDDGSDEAFLSLASRLTGMDAGPVLGLRGVFSSRRYGIVRGTAPKRIWYAEYCPPEAAKELARHPSLMFDLVSASSRARFEAIVMNCSGAGAPNEAFMQLCMDAGLRDAEKPEFTAASGEITIVRSSEEGSTICGMLLGKVAGVARYSNPFSGAKEKAGDRDAFAMLLSAMEKVMKSAAGAAKDIGKD